MKHYAPASYLPVDEPLLVPIPTSFASIVNDSPMRFGNVKFQKARIRGMIAIQTNLANRKDGRQSPRRKKPYSK